MIEQHPNPACRSHVFEQRDPYRQFEADRFGKLRHQFLEAPRSVLLAAANSHADPQRRELRKIAVAAKSKFSRVTFCGSGPDSEGTRRPDRSQSGSASQATRPSSERSFLSHNFDAHRSR
jgi:hypothetical protein